MPSGHFSSVFPVPAAQKCPIEQITGLIAPRVQEKPAGHSSHSASPVVLLYVPVKRRVKELQIYYKITSI